jgi:exonuclease SbcC
MQPLQLTLKGFRGIRDGLGLAELHLDLEHLAGDAQLIAITGPNGSGKTTVMDNLTPYNLLASRAGGGGGGANGIGAFAIYDHVYLPESLKELIWAHEGHVYRSQTIVRLAGRRRTEAFLHQRDHTGGWRPMVLGDGTTSDGRMETYAACVEHICGSAETFFTSVFASQGKRQLNTYRNAEIKTLLADLLGQEEIRLVGQQATETARLLKAGLGMLRQQQAALDQETARLQEARDRADRSGQGTVDAEARLRQAQAMLDAAVARHAQRAVEREQHRATEQQRSRLLAQGEADAAAHASSKAELQNQLQTLSDQQERLAQRVRARHLQAQERRQVLERTRQRCVEQLARAAAVRRAGRRQGLAQRVLERRQTSTQVARRKVQALQQAQDAMRLAKQQLATLEREAGKAVLRVEELGHRHGLTATVPCVGSDLQGRCRLLGDAREAQALLPRCPGPGGALRPAKGGGPGVARRDTPQGASPGRRCGWARLGRMQGGSGQDARRLLRRIGGAVRGVPAGTSHAAGSRCRTGDAASRLYHPVLGHRKKRLNGSRGRMRGAVSLSRSRKPKRARSPPVSGPPWHWRNYRRVAMMPC